MVAIKSNILRRMDNVRPGIRKCCVKFVQVVVQTQTPAQVDPRRKDSQEISSALLPAQHPVLSSKTLEPEAEGLLDRILSIFPENSTDALLIDATLNGFGPLLTTRLTISHKIINAILAFNIFKLANSPMTSTNRILIRSMEKTVSRLLNYWLKRLDPEYGYQLSKRSNYVLTYPPRFPQNQLAHRVTEYLHRLQQNHIAVFNEASRKRPAPVEPADALNDAKRQRLGAQVPAASQPTQMAPVLPPQVADIPVEMRAKVLALTDDPRIFNFNIYQIPFQMIVQMIVAVLSSTPQPALDTAINASRNQIMQYVASQTQSNNRIPLDVPADDDDQYDPLDLKVAEETEQIANQMDMDADDIMMQQGTGLGGAQLPPAPALNSERLRQIHGTVVDRMIRGLDAQRAAAAAASAASPGAKGKGQPPAGPDPTPYLMFVVRLATRVPLGLDAESDDSQMANGTLPPPSYNYADAIRQRLLAYVLQDWRRRIDIAIAWLTEEWMTDTVVARKKRATRRKHSGGGAQDNKGYSADNGAIALRDLPNYNRWLHALLDELTAFIGAEAPEVKVLIRLLSEVPGMDQRVVDKVKRLALDPERIGLVVPALRYLVMYRVPVREWCLDAMVEMYRDYDGVKSLVKKDLARWRPEVLQEEKMDGGDGIKDEG